MRIRALSVFEGVVYHCFCVDRARPCRPVLEVDAVLRDGDDDRPLLLSVPEWAVMVGDPATARRCLEELRRAGRVTEHLGVPHISFPTWTVAATTVRR